MLRNVLCYSPTREPVFIRKIFSLRVQKLKPKRTSINKYSVRWCKNIYDERSEMVVWKILVVIQCPFISDKFQMLEMSKIIKARSRQELVNFPNYEKGLGRTVITLKNNIWKTRSKVSTLKQRSTNSNNISNHGFNYFIVLAEKENLC